MSRTYFDPDTGTNVTASELAARGPERQRAIMRHWFFENYEDPAESTPYESREGGYIWIWGGPYDAEEELRDEFEDVVPSAVIEDLVEEITRAGFFWAPTTSHPSLENAFVDVLASSVPMQTFRERMDSLRRLAALEYPEEGLRQAQYQLLLAASVSALEAYLAERAVRGVQRHEDVLSRFIENHAAFKERKVPVSAVPKLADRLAAYAMNLLAGVVWHRLDIARRIYEDAFEALRWPSAEQLNELIALRHDIVHRAGHTPDGGAVSVAADDISAWFATVEGFVEDLEPQLPIDDDTELDLVPHVGGDPDF